jgi:hypothetical protein
MPSHRELYGDKPGPGCGFVVPSEYLEDKFSTAESKDFQISHVVSCKNCQDKIFKFLTVNNTNPSSFDFTK